MAQRAGQLWRESSGYRRRAKFGGGVACGSALNWVTRSYMNITLRLFRSSDIVVCSRYIPLGGIMCKTKDGNDTSTYKFVAFQLGVPCQCHMCSRDEITLGLYKK